MPQSYTEGQRLLGSDGQIYIVSGGVPRPVGGSTDVSRIVAPNPVRAAREAQTQARQDAAAARAAEAADRASRNDAALTPSKVRESNANATIAELKADEAKATAALTSMTAQSEVHGEEYLKKFVPQAMWATVRAYARGDLGSRSGGLSTSMLPIIQHAMNYDPQASGVNFGARVKMQADLAGSQPNTAGGALRAMERMLLHGREVLRGGERLNNFEPGLLGTIGNAVRTGYEQATNDPTVTGYDQFVRNYAPEAQKAIAQTAGGVEERAAREAAFRASLPQASRAAGLQADARQAFDAMGAVNSQYRRLMGRDILDQLSPDARAAYNEIQAGGYDAAGNPLHPAPGWTPPANGGGGPGGAPGGEPGGDPGPTGAGGPGQNVIGTGMNAVGNPEGQAILAQEQGLLNNKASDDRIREWAANIYGTVPHHIEQMLAARRAGTPINLVPQEGLLTRNVPADNGAIGKVADALATSPLATGIGEAGNAAAAGIPQWLAGKASGNTDLTRLRFDTAAAQNPVAATLGQLGGGAAGAFLGEGLAARGVSKLPWLAKALGGGEMAAARGGDALYGGLSGATSSPDDPYAALKGALFGLGGGMAGRRATSAVGSGLRGVTNPLVQKLKDAGVPLTLGQAVSQSGWLGKAVKGTEDGLLSVPIAGDMAGYTRNRGIAAFNRAGFKEGLSGITNDVPPAIGEQGVEMGLGKVSGAFNDALDGQTIKLPLGPTDPFMAAVKAGAGSKTGGDQFIDVLDRNIAPIANKGTITGRDFQQLDRSTDGYARKFDMLANGTPMTPPQPGYEPVAGAFGDMNAALTDAVRSSNPALLPQYEAAKGAYRNTMVLKDAVNRARNGTRSGDAGVFMPSQLADAAAANSRVFGGTQGTTNQPFFDLTRAGQAVLPSKLADSGTAKRLGILAATGGLLGGGQFSGNETAANASTDAGVTLAALIAAMSPGGQRALRAAVLKRPEWARIAGNTVENAAPYGGLLGAPLALQLQGR